VPNNHDPVHIAPAVNRRNERRARFAGEHIQRPLAAAQPKIHRHYFFFLTCRPIILLPCLLAVAMAIPSGVPDLTIAVAIAAALEAAGPDSFLLCFLAKDLADQDNQSSLIA
jgi:hypothetical protein